VKVLEGWYEFFIFKDDRVHWRSTEKIKTEEGVSSKP